MSKQIDQRIVEMKFDNKEFEKNVSTTMSTLDKLKEKLLLKKAGDGFDDVQKKANKVSFEHLVESVDKLNDAIVKRTGILGSVLRQVEEKIASGFVGALGKIKNMVDQVTFDPIMTGLSEYELKINSIQVIASNTGVLMRDAMRELKGETYDTADAASQLYSTLNQGAEESTGKISKFTQVVSDSEDAMQAAYDVMMGAYGNGEERKTLLGERYEEIQGIVNELIGQTGSVDAALQTLADAGYTFSGVMTDVSGTVSGALEDLDEDVEYTMKDIEYVLDTLNTYADKTIYNYAQMTDAIGQFTVQGVDLYDAETAVEGLANLAAFTGVDATGAARVMREAAKGLATGFIGLQDWMSFETTGGMGGKVFQEQLLATADQLWKTDESYRQYAMEAADAANGIKGSLDESTASISSFVDAQGKFRNSLKAGWLNDKVLVETLHKFAGDLTDAEWAERGYTEQEILDIQALGTVAFEAATKAKTFHQMWDSVTEAAQSSWTTTWEYIFGKFYDARNLWTAIGDELSEVIGGMNEARNAALEFWAKSPYGREKFLLGLSRIYYFLKDAIMSVADAFHNVFGVVEGTDLVKASSKFEQWTRRLEYMSGVIDILGAVATVFFTVLKAGLTIVSAFGMAIGALFGIEPDPSTLDSVGAMAWYIADLVTSFVNLEGLSDGAFGFFYQILNVLKIIPMAIVGVVMGLDELSREFLGFSFIEKIKDFFTHIPEYIEKIKEFFATIKENEKIKEVTQTISDFFDKFKSGFKIDIGNSASAAGLIITIIKALVSLWLVSRTIKLGKGADSLGQMLMDIPTDILDIFEKIKDTADEIKNFAKSGIIITIAQAFIMLAISLGILALIPTDKLETVTATMVLLMVGIAIILKILGGVLDIIPNASILQGAAAFALITIGISNMVGSLLILDLLPLERTIQSVLILAILVGLVARLLKTFDHARFGKTSIAAAVAINLIVGAIAGMVVLVSILSLLMLVNPSGVWQAVLVILALTGIITAVAALAAGFSGKYNGAAVALLGVGLVLIAGAIGALGIVVTYLSAILAVPGNKLQEAAYLVGLLAGIIVVVAAAMALITTEMNVMQLISIVTMAIALPVIILSLTIMAGAVVALSYVPVQNLKIAGLVLLALMVFIYVLMDAFAKLKFDGYGTALAIFAMSKTILIFMTAILIIMGVVWALSMTDFDYKRALVLFGGIAVVLAAIIIAIGAISNIMTGRGGNTINHYLNFGRNSTFSKLLTSIAFLIISIAASIGILVWSLEKLMDAADQFSKDKNMQQKITAMFVGLAQAFLNSWGAIVDAVNHAGVGEMLEVWTISLIDHLINICGRLGLAVVELVGILGEVLIDSIIILLNKLAGTDLATWMDKNTSEVLTEMAGSPLTKIISAIVSLIALIIYGVADAIMANAGPLVFAIFYLIASIVYLIFMVFKVAFDIISGNANSEYFHGQTGGIWDSFADGWKQSQDDALGEMYDYWILGWEDILTSMAHGIMDIFEAFTKVLLGAVGIIFTPYTGIWDLIIAPLLNLIPGVDLTTESTKGMWESIELMFEDVHNSMHNFDSIDLDHSREEFNATSEAASNLADKIGLLKGSNAEVSITMTPKLAQNQEELNIGMYDAMKKAGEEGVKGFNDPWNISSSATEVAISGATKETGKASANGFIAGFDEIISGPAMQSIKEKVKGAMPSINLTDMIDTDSPIDLSTQPVFNLDTSDVGTDLLTGQFGETFQGMGTNMGSMNDLLSGIWTNFGSVTTDLSSVAGYEQDTSDALAAEGGKFYDDTELVDEVSGLRSDVGALSEAMTKIKMYLDGNKLVGELVGPLDEALASRSTRASRGN